MCVSSFSFFSLSFVVLIVNIYIYIYIFKMREFWNRNELYACVYFMYLNKNSNLNFIFIYRERNWWRCLLVSKINAAHDVAINWNARNQYDLMKIDEHKLDRISSHTSLLNYILIKWMYAYKFIGGNQNHFVCQTGKQSRHISIKISQHIWLY